MPEVHQQVNITEEIGQQIVTFKLLIKTFLSMLPLFFVLVLVISIAGSIIYYACKNRLRKCLQRKGANARNRPEERDEMLQTEHVELETILQAQSLKRTSAATSEQKTNDRPKTSSGQNQNILQHLNFKLDQIKK